MPAVALRHPDGVTVTAAMTSMGDMAVSTARTVEEEEEEEGRRAMLEMGTAVITCLVEGACIAPLPQ